MTMRGNVRRVPVYAVHSHFQAKSIQMYPWLHR